MLFQQHICFDQSWSYAQLIYVAILIYWFIDLNCLTKSITLTKKFFEAEAICSILIFIYQVLWTYLIKLYFQAFLN